MLKRELLELIEAWPDEAEIVTLGDDGETIREVKAVGMYGLGETEPFIVIGNVP